MTVITTLRLKICNANNTEHGDPEVWEPHINVFIPMTVMATIEIVQGHFGTVTMTIGTRFVEFIKTNHNGYPGTS